MPRGVRKIQRTDEEKKQLSASLGIKSIMRKAKQLVTDAIDEQIKKLQSEIDGLLTAKRLVMALRGETAVAAPPPQIAGGTDSFITKIRRYLKSAGPSSIGAIASGTNLTSQIVRDVVEHTSGFDQRTDGKIALD